MSTPFIGQIQVFGFNFPPKGWALCNGQLLPINQNQALFSLLGTYFGGNGTVNFALPNLQGAFEVHQGTSAGGTYNLGQTGGETNHVLSVPEMASHTHPMVGSTATATSSTPVGNLPGQNASYNLYSSAPTTALGSGSSPAGSSQPHNNMPPYLVVNVCIALQGIFPSRN